MTRNVLLLGFVLMQIGLSGCIIDPTVVEDDFGQSVRQMVEGQIYDPVTASNPSVDGPLIVDGVVVGTIVGGYREAAKRKADSTNTITFTVR